MDVLNAVDNEYTRRFKWRVPAAGLEKIDVARQKTGSCTKDLAAMVLAEEFHLKASSFKQGCLVTAVNKL